jgi:molecular chaperone GrpE
MKLLPVVDDLERMIDHHLEDGNCSVEGIQLIFANLKKVLVEEGLEEIEAANQMFDPEIHEAVDVQEVAPAEDGKVIDVWQKGYRFKERMLRPSRVRVGKSPE